MSEENTEETKAEEAAPVEEAPKAEAPKAAPAAEATETGEKKKKKISKMTMAEVEAAIKKATGEMNGANAKYVKSLVARKEEISSKA